jgi:3-hydroxybutyryl-CoA dehydrogenase
VTPHAMPKLRSATMDARMDERVRVGVVGAGVIGVGVAENLAATGHVVILVDVSSERLEAATHRLRDSLRSSRLLGRQMSDEAPAAVLARVEPTLSYEPMAQASFVIENVVERWDVKKRVYERLDAVCPRDCILAANTSAIPIHHIAASTHRADRVVGVHFMNPVPQKPTVEVVRGRETTAETIARTGQLLARMGKQAIVVGDRPGFVSNRILMLTVNEAMLTVEQGIADATQVDRLFRECFGHAMGPLETADLIGLDTILDTLNVLREFTGEDKFLPCTLLRRMVDAGLTGRKCGRGFYRYD